MLGLIGSLRSSIRRLRWEPVGTAWADYYDSTNYTSTAFQQKKSLLDEYLDVSRPDTVWDLGANTGLFSRLASERGIKTIAFDIDPGAVEINYRAVCAQGQDHLIPLVLDLTNPSSAAGWGLQERQSLFERGPADAVLALALVHHLAIGNNLPLAMIAGTFRQLGKWLVIEFVPKQDSQVQRLLAAREDIFPDYHRPGFEEAFSAFYTIRRSQPVPESERILYLMEGLD
jgi:ribosomal protein L11 methylase PrmA